MEGVGGKEWSEMNRVGSLHVSGEGCYIINMSIPGVAREKYAHEVKFVGQKRCGWKRMGAVVVLLMLGLLIYACCNISSMRSQIREMRRMMHEHRHDHHQHHHHDMHNHGHQGHDHHGHHHHQRVRGNQNHQHDHPQPMPEPHHRDCQGKAEAQLKNIGADLTGRMADIDSFLKTRIPTLERKIDQISKELLSKQDFSKRIYAKLNEFQTYLTSIVDSLKISSWFS